VPFIEPLGDRRELFYEAKLLLALAWYCDAPPENIGGEVEWKIRWQPPDHEELGGMKLEPITLTLGKKRDVCWEVLCAKYEAEFCEHELGLICACCSEELPDSVCESCRYAIGWHRCSNPNGMGTLVWRKGSLHAGKLDVQRALFNLHRRMVPTDVLREKADKYIEAKYLTAEQAAAIIRVIEQERNYTSTANDGVAGDAAAASTTGCSHKLTQAQLNDLLTDREAKMRASQHGGVTDQWRVYQHITDCIARGKWLRLMVQASAGTGKSFLLATVYLWCIVHSKKCKAAAPTGIAAANVEIENTDVAATTIHEP
jgi:hypothetical protein